MKFIYFTWWFFKIILILFNWNKYSQGLNESDPYWLCKTRAIYLKMTFTCSLCFFSFLFLIKRKSKREADLPTDCFFLINLKSNTIERGNVRSYLASLVLTCKSSNKETTAGKTFKTQPFSPVSESISLG